MREEYSAGRAVLIAGGSAAPPPDLPWFRAEPDPSLPPGCAPPLRLPAPHEDFPLLARPHAAARSAALEDFAAATRALLDQRLADAGAILLRGLPIPGAAAFSRFRAALGYAPVAYQGVASRREVAPGVLTPSLAPPERAIMLHNEMAFEHVAPRHVFFYCESSLGSAAGGETLVARNADWDAELGEPLIARFIERGVVRGVVHRDRSHASIPQQSWQAHFGTESREEAERICRERDKRFRWLEDGSLAAFGEVPAAIDVSGKRVWFCALQNTQPASDVVFRYADGQAIEPEILDLVRAAQWRIAVAFAWQRGDVLCIDNLHCQHGRLPYRGEVERKVLVSLGTPCRLRRWRDGGAADV